MPQRHESYRSWLLVPVTDINFTSAVETAPRDVLAAVLADRGDVPGNTKRCAAIRRRLRWIDSGAAADAAPAPAPEAMEWGCRYCDAIGSRMPATLRCGCDAYLMLRPARRQAVPA
ncbi:MAG TPA: hypothetical protein VGC13_22420 [Longimicrobium sp.]|uniref:hypothetical protein n=1 Tax=Longimicrobium sp. TaxID=2029185 RepID=UPI002EDA1AC5